VPNHGFATKRDPQTLDGCGSPGTNGASKSPRSDYLEPPRYPNPSAYGIAADYFERAIEGAQAWRVRARAIPPKLTIKLRVASWITALVIYCWAITEVDGNWLALPGLIWFAIPALTESVIATIEKSHDKKLKASVFDPEYNPNPEGWLAYARDCAKVDGLLATVFVARTGYRYHTRSWCSSMSSPRELPRYKAEAQGYTPCSHCGFRLTFPKLLPPPFGNGDPAPK